METIAVVRSEYGGQTELDVPGVTEHGHDVGQGQVQLLLADGGEAGPCYVTAEAPLINRAWNGKMSVSDMKKKRNSYFELWTTFEIYLHSLQFPKIHK